jgi:hypothetical protein
MASAHTDILPADNHTPYRWIFANATERLSYIPVTADLYKKALQLDNEKEYTLISLSPIRWKEFGAANSIPTTTVARLNPSPVVNVVEGLSIDPNYSCLTLTCVADITLISTPNIRAATNNAQELTLVNIGNFDITFQSELALTGSQVAEDFTLSPTNRIAKLIFIKGLDKWYKY